MEHEELNNFKSDNVINSARIISREKDTINYDFLYKKCCNLLNEKYEVLDEIDDNTISFDFEGKIFVFSLKKVEDISLSIFLIKKFKLKNDEIGPPERSEIFEVLNKINIVAKVTKVSLFEGDSFDKNEIGICFCFEQFIYDDFKLSNLFDSAITSINIFSGIFDKEIRKSELKGKVDE